MNIYLTLDSTPYAGGGQVILNELTKFESEQAVLICPKGKLATEASDHATVITFDKTAKLIDKVKAVRKAILPLTAKGNTLHVHGISTLLLAVISTYGMTVKRSYTEHLLTKEYTLENKLTYKFHLFAYKILLNFMDQIVAVSNAVRDFLVNDLKINKNKITVQYNPVSWSQKKVEYRYKAVTSLVSTGSLVYIKNYGQLLEIFAAASRQVELKLTIIGDGDQRNALEAKAKELGISDKVTFVGNIEHEQIFDHLENSDIYVQTSLSESFGYAITEALAVGLPVVAFDVGGIGEVVEHNKSGLLIKPHDTAEFTEAIVSLTYDVELRRRFGNYARESLKKFKN
jgi:glycosyltransferase involved in cell wall biosynthesis